MPSQSPTDRRPLRAADSTRPAVRCAALLLALLAVFGVGLTFTTQTASHAFAPIAAPVALSVVRTVAVPIGQAAARTVLPTVRGAARFASGTNLAQLACSLFGEGCPLPWQQSPSHAPNGDQPPSNSASCAGGSYIWTNAAPVNSSRPGPDAYAATAGPTNPSGSTGCTILATFVAAAGESSNRAFTHRMYYADGRLLGENVFQFCSGGSSTLGPSSLSTVSSGGITYNSCLARVGVAFGSGAAAGCLTGSGMGTVCLTNTAYQPAPGSAGAAATPAGTPTYPDPLRTGQPVRYCTGPNGTARVHGDPIQYRESEGARTAALPACPAAYPTPYGGGLAAGSPWTPGTVTPSPSPLMPVTPLVPPVVMPGPAILPLAPTTPTLPRRTPAPTVTPTPLPEIDPVTGEPATDPDGRPRVQPVPAPVPGEGHCMWGGYVVDPADCEGLPPPADPPTGTPSNGPTPSPSPTGTRTANPCGPRAVSTQLSDDGGADYCLPDGDGDGLPDGSDGDDDGDGIPDGQDPTPRGDAAPPLPPSDPGCLSGWDATPNPLTWVYEPVRCALLWAFLPSEGTRQRVVDLGETVPTRVPFVWVSALDDDVAALGASSSSCWTGPAVTVTPLDTTTTIRPLDTCPGSWLGDGAPTVRPVLSAALWASILVPLGTWLFRQSVPVVGGGDA